jgi:type I restriction enzyme M protein
MTHVATIEDFLTNFFKIFSSKTFPGGNYLEYLNRLSEQRSGDEASIVDRAIVGPLLDLLGFAPAEQVYNQQCQNGRPDFAPADALLGSAPVEEEEIGNSPSEDL